jgi:hypothetical protein
MFMHLKKYFLTYTLVPLFIISIIASVYRFMILNDYLVTYEIDCDPASTSCFVGCENEECSEEYYYQLVTREASKIESLCGVDITNCESANYCQTNEPHCVVEQCDASNNECSNTSL